MAGTKNIIGLGIDPSLAAPLPVSRLTIDSGSTASRMRQCKGDARARQSATAAPKVLPRHEDALIVPKAATACGCRTVRVGKRNGARDADCEREVSCIVPSVLKAVTIIRPETLVRCHRRCACLRPLRGNFR